MNILKDFTPALEAWFRDYGRHDLPWRTDYVPYQVWVSEIMLQQTQVPRVADKFYPQFLTAFPDIKSLANASWDEVFPVWQGLGYYSRGKNMLRTAQAVVEQFDGEFPQDANLLKMLPGIGTYTAAAILSFAFDQKTPALDTNINKILKVLAPRQNTVRLAQKLINQSNSGRDWNGAMMDLATALRAKQEIHGPLSEFFPESVRQRFIPQRKPRSPQAKKPKSKSNKKRIEVGIACIYRDGKYLIQTRPDDKSFAGMWEFPGGKRNPREDFRTCVKREIEEEIGVKVSVRPHFLAETHRFEHADLHLRFHRCQIQAGTPKSLENQELKWVSPKDFGSVDFLPTNGKAVAKLREMRV